MAKEKLSQEQRKGLNSMAWRVAVVIFFTMLVVVIVMVGALFALHGDRVSAMIEAMPFYVPLLCEFLILTLAAHTLLLPRMFRPRKHYTLVANVPPDQLKPYCWRWVFYTLAMEILVAAAFAGLDIATHKTSESHGGGVMSLVVIYLTTYLIGERMVRRGEATIQFS